MNTIKLTLLATLLLIPLAAIHAADAPISHRVLVTDYKGKQPMVFEVTRDKNVVWEFADHVRFKTVCQVQVIDAAADAAKGEVLR